MENGDVQDWQLDFEWLRVRHHLRDILGLEKLPDLNAILLLIGIRELGEHRTDFSKEEKQDLMHIAVCSLLEDEYYEFEGMDADGWPHWKPLRPIEVKGVDSQEKMLKVRIVKYFDEIYNTGFVQQN